MHQFEDFKVGDSVWFSSGIVEEEFEVIEVGTSSIMVRRKGAPDKEPGNIYHKKMLTKKRPVRFKGKV